MYICQTDWCWYKSSSKLWICPSCQEYWSFAKEDNWVEKKKEKKEIKLGEVIKSKTLWMNIEWYYDISNKEVKRVFWEWIKKWWVYLLWWEPWIWKSTILLQLMDMVKKWNDDISIWYYSWEENENQIKERINRLKIKSKADIFYTTILEDVVATIVAKKHNFVIIDSIQTLESVENKWRAGGVSQITYISSKITDFFKENWITAIIIWHVTKWWEVAWPKYLEHIVDALIYLEWDKFWLYRFLRAKKNRFWPSEEVWIFTMDEDWLKAVDNYNEFIMKDFSPVPWNILSMWLDNWRPVFANIEVIATKSSYNFPQRKAIWIAKERLELIVAIFESIIKKPLGETDIFLNIPWEIKFKDNWLDLWIFAALWGAVFNKSFKWKVFFGELKLMWKVQQSSFHKKRIKECRNIEVVDYEKLSFVNDIKNFAEKD